MSNSFSFFCVVLAARTKSALFPFSTWLPEAIAAPTPISSLVHSSTLVTAGFVLVLLSYLTLSSLFIGYFLRVSLLALIISSLSAFTQPDAKKLVALSTLRQVAFICCVGGMGLPTLALSHIITHALFKSCLFIALGRLLYLRDSNQDFRYLAITPSQSMLSRGLFIPLLSLIGMSWTCGFISKEAVVLYCFSYYNSLIIIVILIAACSTVVYRIRLLFILVSSVPLVNTSINPPPILLIPANLVGVISVFAGLFVLSSTVPRYQPHFRVLYIGLAVLVFTSLRVLDRRSSLNYNPAPVLNNYVCLTTTLTHNAPLLLVGRSSLFKAIIERGAMEKIWRAGINYTFKSYLSVRLWTALSLR